MMNKSMKHLDNKNENKEIVNRYLFVFVKLENDNMLMQIFEKFHVKI